jgi:putative PIN family toxin of toxin-antitoxin system
MLWVLDTNIVASGLLWNGTPARLLDAAQTDKVALFTSLILLAELTRILRREKFSKAIVASGLTLGALVLGYAELATPVTPVPIAPMILDDPDDDHVLACALAAQANLIVSGDHHLLDLKTYQGIRIVTASEALQLLTAKQ